MARMEDVLELYAKPYNPHEPVVCFDECPVHLLGDVRQALPAKPGKPARQDYEYVRGGNSNLLVCVQPLADWRDVEVSASRTKIDFAGRMKFLVDDRFPDADVVHIVLDNLNTHTMGALYEAFPAPEARRIARRLRFHFTPLHGSWLNMAEIELSAISRECLSRRIPDSDALRDAVKACQQSRNDAHATIQWRFTVQDARLKFHRFYPNDSLQ